MKKTGSDLYILDTNIVIDLFKGQRNIANKIDEAGEVYVPIPVLGELYLGAWPIGAHPETPYRALLRGLSVAPAGGPQACPPWRG